MPGTCLYYVMFVMENKTSDQIRIFPLKCKRMLFTPLVIWMYQFNFMGYDIWMF